MGSMSDGPTENRPWGPNVWPFSVRLLGDGGVQILLWNRPGLGERPVAGDVLRCFLQIGLALIELGPEAIDHGDVTGAREIGLRLGELGSRRLQRRGVFLALDHKKRLPLLNLGAFLEQHLLEHAGNASPHLDGGDGLGARRVLADDGDGALDHLGDDHGGYRRRRRGLFGVLRPLTPERGEEQHHEAERSGRETSMRPGSRSETVVVRIDAQPAGPLGDVPAV
jgi:hypothetical protein